MSVSAQHVPGHGHLAASALLSTRHARRQPCTHGRQVDWECRPLKEESAVNIIVFLL